MNVIYTIKLCLSVHSTRSQSFSKIAQPVCELHRQMVTRHVLMGQIPPTTTLESWTTIKWSILPIQLDSKELWPSGYVCTVTLTLEIWPRFKVMTHPWAMDNNCVTCYPDPTWQWGVMARTQILGMCIQWPWPLRYDLGSRSWRTLEPWTTIVWNIIQIQRGSEELWPGHGFWVCAYSDLDLWGMTLGQGHDKLGSWTTIV